jgi:hypothetical protein
MKHLVLALFALAVAALFVTADAEAGGRSRQRGRSFAAPAVVYQQQAFAAPAFRQRSFSLNVQRNQFYAPPVQQTFAAPPAYYAAPPVQQQFFAPPPPVQFAAPPVACYGQGICPPPVQTFAAPAYGGFSRQRSFSFQRSQFGY